MEPILAQSPLFQSIPTDKIQDLLACLGSVTRTYQKDAFIFRSGERLQSFGIVLSGLVQVSQIDILGNRSIAVTLGPGDLFAEVFACAGTAHIPVDVSAAADCRILLIDSQKLAGNCGKNCPYHTQVIQNMMQILATKNIYLNARLTHLSKRSTREKVLSYLSDFAQQTGHKTFVIPFNRQELADYLCVERSALSSVLGTLQREGFLRFQRNKFTIYYNRDFTL